MHLSMDISPFSPSLHLSRYIKKLIRVKTIVVEITDLAALCSLLPVGIVLENIWFYFYTLQHNFSATLAGREVYSGLGLDQDLRHE